MFDPSKFSVPSAPSFAKRLNSVVADINSHGGSLSLGFVSRGKYTAYAKGTRFGVCLFLGEDSVRVYFHPSRGDREAWEMSATDGGCQELSNDSDMDEDKILFQPETSTFDPDVDVSFYDVVLLVARRAA